MTRLPLTSFTLATICLTALAAAVPAGAQQAAPPPQLVTNGPQFTPGDAAGAASAAQNVRESAQYEALLRANPAFRAVRMRKECGPISDPQLRASCLASFGAPYYASVPARYGNYSQNAKINEN